jgi:hypothetical protein
MQPLTIGSIVNGWELMVHGDSYPLHDFDNGSDEIL